MECWIDGGAGAEWRSVGVVRSDPSADPVSGSLKEVFGFFEEALADGAFLAAAELGEFFELGFLRGGQMRRNFNVDANVQVAVAVALNVFDPFTFEPEHGAGLCAGGDTDAGLAIQRGDLDFGPEGRLDKIDRDLAQKIITIALKDFMRSHVQDHVQVARWSTAEASFAIARRTQA